MKVILEQSLKSMLKDALKTRQVLSRNEVKKIARDNGYEESNAERRLRAENGWERRWITRLNSKKKKVKKGEKIYFYQWSGPKTIFYATNTIKTKKKVRSR